MIVVCPVEASVGLSRTMIPPPRLRSNWSISVWKVPGPTWLSRTVLGEFTLSQARTLEQLEAGAEIGDIEELFIHPRELLPQFPCVTATEEMAVRIRSGRAVNLPELSRARRVKVFHGQRELIAIASRVAGTLFHPKIVLADDPTPELARHK